MTTAQNADVKSGYDIVTGRPVTPGTAINQGDMVYNSGSAAYELLPLDTDAHAARFEGIAEDSYPTASGIGTLTNDIALIDGIRVRRHGIVNMNGTGTETYYHGDALYMVTDAQTVTKATGGGGTSNHPVGYVCLGNNLASLTMATGVKIPMLICPQYPATI